MREEYYPPEFDKDSFHCPHCNVYAHQLWYDAHYSQYDEEDGTYTEYQKIIDFKISACQRCGKDSLWYNKKLVSPKTSLAPKPTKDMPKGIKEDYQEAANIVSDSPRAAAALLRLAVQKLMKHLGEKGKKLDDDIATLVKKGLPVIIQNSLDIIRVIGNNAVHPGQIDLKEDIEKVFSLFSQINKIVDIMITEPKETLELYLKLPEKARKAIEKRDKEST